MKKLVIFLSVIAYAFTTEAQQLAGEWNMEPLTAVSQLGKEVGILSNEDFHTKGIKFGNGKFYCRNVEKGTFKQEGDTLILSRKKEDILAFKKRLEATILPKDQFEDKMQYNQQLLDLVEKVNLYATDTLVVYRNWEGNAMLLNSVNSEYRRISHSEVVYYLHKKNTNTSLNKNRSIEGKWKTEYDGGIILDFRNDGKVDAYSIKEKATKTEKYKFRGEHLTIGTDTHKTETLRFVMGNANVAFVERDQQGKNPTKLERIEKIEENQPVIEKTDSKNKSKKNGKRR